MTVTVRAQASRIISSCVCDDIRAYIDGDGDMRIEQNGDTITVGGRAEVLALSDVLRELAAALPEEPAEGEAA